MNIDDVLELDDGLKLFYPAVCKTEINSITSISVPKENTLFFLKEYKFYKSWHDTVITDEKKSWLKTGVIVDKKLLEDKDKRNFISSNVGFIIESDNVDLSICLLSKVFYDERFGKKNDLDDGRDTGTVKIHSSVLIAKGVFIGESVEIGEDVKIHAGCVIMSGTKIKKNTVLYPNVTIYYDVEIGENCRLHSGVVIGADGFGYKNIDGIHRKIWHIGSVIIRNNVEIGALSSVDSGTFTPTIIGEGTIIDNQVQIGHNSQLGKGVILCGQSGTSGSAIVGDYTVCGGKSGISDGVTVGKNSQIAGNAMVNTSWPEKSILGGHPARPLREWLRGLAYVRKQVQGQKSNKQR